MEIYFENGKFEVIEDNKRMILNKYEFLSFIKSCAEENVYDIENFIHEDIGLMFYVFEKLNIPTPKFYEMNKVDEVLNKYSKYELLKHLDEYFNVDDEYFYTETNYYDKEVIYSMNESEVHEYFLHDTDDKLEKIIKNNIEKVYNTIIEFIENK